MDEQSQTITVDAEQSQTITLKGAEYPVRSPDSPSIAIDIIGNQHTIRVVGAMVAICCPRVERKLKIGTIQKHRYDVLSYGGAAYDAMIARGCTPSEIQAAATVCLDVLVESLPKLAEVEADEDFFEATP